MQDGESGLGRWDERVIYPLSFREYLRVLGAGRETAEETVRRLPTTIERFMMSGGFPEHVFNEDITEVRTRLRTDIADRAVRRDLAGIGGRGLDTERVVRLLTSLDSKLREHIRCNRLGSGYGG